jgi:ubiquinone biosynthesis protein
VGWQGLIDRMKNEAPRYAQLLPELPRLLHQALQKGQTEAESGAMVALLSEQRRTNRLLQGLVWAVLGFMAGLLLAQWWLRQPL